MNDFKYKVLEKTKEIPQGKVTTYKELAGAIGRPEAARAVARALANNQELIKIPCHRVIRSNSRVGGYVLGREKKKELLRSEGVLVDKKGRVDLNKYIYSC